MMEGGYKPKLTILLVLSIFARVASVAGHFEEDAQCPDGVSEAEPGLCR